MKPSSTGSEIYRNLTRARVLWIVIMSVTMTALFFGNMMINTNADPVEVLKAIFQPESVKKNVYNIVIYYRLPESCFGLMVGASLALAGAEMQTILNNPLAEPYTLGLSSAASFGAALSIAFNVGRSSFGNYATVILAFVFSMIVCLLISFVASRRNSRPVITILVGVAMLFVFQALVSLIQSIVSREAASTILFWMFGSIGRDTNYADIMILAAALVSTTVLFILNSWKLSALRLGDNKAFTLGINVPRLRRNTIIGISIVTATAVSFTGTIGFVGLVGPHMARMMVGDDQRFLIPMSMTCGASMVLAASIVCKLTVFTSILPIGIMTTFIGIPFFLYLVAKKREVLS